MTEDLAELCFKLDFFVGSAHTVLADYWRKQLGITTFYGMFCLTYSRKLFLKLAPTFINF